MTNVINFDSQRTPIRTEVFSPVGSTGAAAIVIAHGSDGLTPPWADLIREYATDLAARGFTVFVPNYLEKTGTSPGPQVFSQIPAKLGTWVEAVGDVVANVKTLPGLDASRVGLLGFSLGGHISLRLRAVTPALAAFFAPEFRPFGGIGGRSAATPRVELHYGLADLLVPFGEAKAIAASLTAEGRTPAVFSYEGAGHGFAGADPNNASARRASKNRVLSFFEASLRAASEVRSA